MLSIDMPSIAIASCEGAEESCIVFVRQQDATCIFGQSAAASTLPQPLTRSASNVRPMNEVTRRIVTESCLMPRMAFQFTTCFVNREKPNSFSLFSIYHL